MIDAKYIYDLLGVKRDFTSWVKDLISDYEEGTDYQYADGSLPDLNYGLPKNGEPEVKGRKGGWDMPSKYYFSVEMIQEICMLSKTEIGKKVRQQFVYSNKIMQEVFKKGLIAKVCYILRGYVYKKILSVDHLKSILVPLGYMDEDDNISLYELMEKNFGNNRITPESIESFVTFFVGAGVITDGGNKIIIKKGD